MSTPKTVLTEDAAELLKLSKETMRRWGRLGNGPIKPVKVGRKFLWRLEDINRLLAGE
ncbi:MAG: helix-turn-helix domain-containing protein [Rhodoferax sp.]|uniref:helix-turn-helix domain-containing protein n=1 Tax=Rhodoferax sp. TaxID=50421 RepID=UPI00261A1BBC|nr:helix-turn-helix domain-containing protein [Rhodoferax sp.]MDD2883072.1 helix-turn-helix domain-containing protein [Rhodoferax sp.]